MEFGDLTAAVAEQSIADHHAVEDAVDQSGAVALTVDLLTCGKVHAHHQRGAEGAAQATFRRGQLRRRRGVIPLLRNDLAEGLRHLLKNACEATPSGESIQIRTGSSGAEAFVEVQDAGPGMDQEMLRRCMDPFFSGNDKAGLGLSLVWAIARRHSGRVVVDSQPGHGTRVAIWLPLESDTATLPFTAPKRRNTRKGVA